MDGEQGCGGIDTESHARLPRGPAGIRAPVGGAGTHARPFPLSRTSIGDCSHMVKPLAYIGAHGHCYCYYNERVRCEDSDESDPSANPVFSELLPLSREIERVRPISLSSRILETTRRNN